MFSKRLKLFFQGNNRNLLMILAVIGIAAVMYGFKYDRSISMLGIVIVLICLTAYTGFYGIQIDYNHQKYLNYLSVLGLKAGRWKSLPPISGIILLPQKKPYRPSSFRSNIYEGLFIVKLVPSGGTEPILASVGPYHELVLEADTLSKGMGVPVTGDFK